MSLENMPSFGWRHDEKTKKACFTVNDKEVSEEEYRREWEEAWKRIEAYRKEDTMSDPVEGTSGGDAV